MSGCDEFIPFARQIAILVHHRVPHRDVTEPLRDGAAVTYRARLFHDLAEWILDFRRGRLAVVPVIPLRLGQELARVLRLRRIIALPRDERALETAGVPVEIFVEAVALEAVEM